MKLVYFMVLAVGLVAVGCGSDSSPGNCNASNATATTSVSLTNNTFSPSCIKVSQGAEVTFTNEDSVNHTVTTETFQAEAFDSGQIAPNGTFKHTFNVKGTILVRDMNTVAMTGSVVVQ